MGALPPNPRACRRARPSASAAGEFYCVPAMGYYSKLTAFTNFFRLIALLVWKDNVTAKSYSLWTGKEVVEKALSANGCWSVVKPGRAKAEK